MECTLGRCDRLQGLKYRDQAHLQAVPGFKTCLGMVWYEYNLNVGCAFSADSNSPWHCTVSPELAKCCRVRLRRLRSSLILLKRLNLEGAPRRLPSLLLSASARSQVRERTVS